jgi:hypothetical protein
VYSVVFENPWCCGYTGDVYYLPPLFLSDDFSPYVYIRERTLVLIYKLSWGDHVSTVCRKVYGTLAGLRILADVTPFAVRMRLIAIGDCVYFVLDSYSLRKFTVVFNACVRYVNERRLLGHISDVLDSILGCSLLTYVVFRLACFMFSLERISLFFGSLVFSHSEEQKGSTFSGSPPNTW